MSEPAQETVAERLADMYSEDTLTLEELEAECVEFGEVLEKPLSELPPHWRRVVGHLASPIPPPPPFDENRAHMVIEP